MNRAEQILAALKTQLTGLATTGANVYRAYEQVSALPALVIRKGDDIKTSEQNSSVVDRDLSIQLEITVRNTATAGTDLNTIIGEIYAAIAAAPLLGLGFVITTDLETEEQADERDNSSPVVQQLILYTVRYRHSYLSTEV